VRPSLEALLAGQTVADVAAVMHDAVRANVRWSVNQLRHGSELLERLIEEDGLMVVGADYSLESGIVSFFEGLEEAGSAFQVHV
jgi:carbonic anhydrase